MSQLLPDCLEDIFEYLEEDEITLHSCLLVNRLWCKISVRISWRRIRSYSALIACLSNESKENLHRGEIIITSLSTSKPPMFNYASFCKVLSIKDVSDGIKKLLENQPSISFKNFNDNLHVVTGEILKLLMNQASLRKLEF